MTKPIVWMSQEENILMEFKLCLLEYDTDKVVVESNRILLVVIVVVAMTSILKLKFLNIVH